MSLFDFYIMVDWSGATRRRGMRADTIWIAYGGCVSSEHFGHLVWQFKRVSGSSGLKVQAAIAC